MVYENSNTTTQNKKSRFLLAPPKGIILRGLPRNQMFVSYECLADLPRGSLLDTFGLLEPFKDFVFDFLPFFTHILMGNPSAN